MLVTEPIVACIAIYASFVYGLLFFQLESFPIVFREERGWQLVDSTLPFLGLFAGVLFALIINIANQPLYAKAVAKNKSRAVPEARLPPMLVGGVLFSSGLFWFGWTAAPKYSWGLPVVAAGESASILKQYFIDDSWLRFYRCWVQYHLPAMSELPRGYLRAIFSKRFSWKHLSAFNTCLWASIGSPPNVLELRSRTCM